MKVPRSLYFIKSRTKTDGEIRNLNFFYDYSLIPEQPGVYIVVSEKTKFIYPQKSSPVIYVGMTKDLRQRLTGHIRHFRTLQKIPKSHRWYFSYYSRYNYMVNHGCRIYWLTIRGKQKPKDLESQILEEFYKAFHSLPVGNGAFSFASL
jgi:excinuclease UvrABC nuclease subunit